MYRSQPRKKATVKKSTNDNRGNKKSLSASIPFYEQKKSFLVSWAAVSIFCFCQLWNCIFYRLCRLSSEIANDLSFTLYVLMLRWQDGRVPAPVSPYNDKWPACICKSSIGRGSYNNEYRSPPDTLSCSTCLHSGNGASNFQIKLYSMLGLSVHVRVRVNTPNM